MNELNELNDVEKVTRLEVIDESGRAYVRWNLESIQVSFQDNNRTLKIFVSGKVARKSE